MANTGEVIGSARTRMDLMSEVIGSVRTGRTRACAVTDSGAWGRRYSAFEGSGFHLVLDGHGWLITAGDPPRELGPGDVVLAPGGAEHGLSHAPCSLDSLPPAVVDPGAPIIDRPGIAFLCGAYYLDYGKVHQFLRALPAVLVVSAAEPSESALRLLGDLLATDIAGDLPGTEMTRRALFDLMFTHALRQWQEQNRPAWLQVEDPAITAVLHEIHTHPDRPWTVQQLGEIAGMSRAAFTKRFTAVVGSPPFGYLSHWRLARGARLLRESTDPLATIARQVGYSSEFAFSSAFRRAYGVAPGRFRAFEQPVPVAVDPGSFTGTVRQAVMR